MANLAIVRSTLGKGILVGLLTLFLLTPTVPAFAQDRDISPHLTKTGANYAEIDISAENLFYWSFHHREYAQVILDKCSGIREERSLTDVAGEILAHGIGWHIFHNERARIAGITANEPVRWYWFILGQD